MVAYTPAAEMDKVAGVVPSAVVALRLEVDAVPNYVAAAWLPEEVLHLAVAQPLVVAMAGD